MGRAFAGVDRRSLLAGAAALASTGAAFAQAPLTAREKGPRVWLDMDQAELDDAYDQRKYAPNTQQVLARFATNSEAVRARLGAPKRLAYGPTEIEKLDLYAAERPDAPVHIHIHGGAWRSGRSKDFAYAAEMFLRAGAHFVVPDFINVVESGGDLARMADQVRRAVAWVHANAAAIGGDPSRIYLSGHSSGAHLAGVALIADWERYGAPASVIRGAVLCSGIYDLKPVRLSARSRYVNLTDEIEDALSTQRHVSKISVPLVLAYGSKETPEFQRQTRDFSAALRGAGKPAELLVGENYNHFEMPETFANPYGLLGRAGLAQMNLRPA